jgi:hypothetical protein
MTVKASNRAQDCPIFEIEQNNTLLPLRAKAWSKMTYKMKLGLGALMNTAKIKIAVNMAIADASATAHFAIPGAPVINKKLPPPHSSSTSLTVNNSNPHTHVN